MTESQKPPNLLILPVSCATLPSMKSKMLAAIRMTPADTNRFRARSTAAQPLTRTPMNVRVFGWIRSATHTAMMARSGNIQTRPTRPVKVILEKGPV